MLYHNKRIQGWSQLQQAGKLDGNPEKRGTGILKWMSGTWWHSDGSKEQWPGAVSSSEGLIYVLSLKGSESVKGRHRECF